MGRLGKYWVGSLASLVMACGCSGETTQAGEQQRNVASTSVGSSSGGGTAIGPPESGETHSPDLPIEGSDTIAILGSALRRRADGKIFWAFTFRNDAPEPYCGIGLINAEVFDAAGTMLAGASVFSEEYQAGFPAFNGIVMGSVYHGLREDGVAFLDVCVPPGGRGLAFAEVSNVEKLLPDEVDRIVDAAASLRHDLTHVGPSLLDMKLAPDLPRLSELRLVDTPEGKLVEGVALSSADLTTWRAWIVLYDANGAIADVVHAPVEIIETLSDTPVRFSSTPTAVEPARLEVFFESSGLRH